MNNYIPGYTEYLDLNHRYYIVIALKKELENNIYDCHFFDEKGEIKEGFDTLRKADILTSSSLFMDVDTKAITVVENEADDIYIAEVKASLTEDMTEFFGGLSKYEKRSVMAKVLSIMPVFFNSQQEILDYFSYALSSCSDKCSGIRTKCFRIC